jgi:hypothetical protein
VEIETEPIDWPTEFARTPTLASLTWEEVRPGIWFAEHAEPQLVAAVTPTERLWYATTAQEVSPQLSFQMHDVLAGRLRAAGWLVGCAGPSCAYTWPCPRREMHDFMGERNGGELHTPIGTAKRPAE